MQASGSAKIDPLMGAFNAMPLTVKNPFFGAAKRNWDLGVPPRGRVIFLLSVAW